MNSSDPIQASRSVLIEVANALGSFREQMVVVGGWVPELWYPDRGHVGSLDVDFAVTTAALAPNVYETILRRLLNAGYSLRTGPTHFEKTLPGIPNPVKVDLLCGREPNGDEAMAEIDGLQISRLSGMGLAFAAASEIDVAGAMPGGTRNSVRVRVVRPEAFVLVKAFALDERLKAKDAYDIAFVLANYRPNLAELAGRIQGLAGHGEAERAVEILRAKFATVDSVGPVQAAAVSAENGGQDVGRAARAAYEDARELFRRLDGK